MKGATDSSLARLRVFQSKWFHRFSRKEGIEESALMEAVDRVVAGQIDANLGGGVLKQRIARPGEGKSGGFRTVLLFRQGERAVFLYGFPKSERDNLQADEEKAFKVAAKYVLALTEAQMSALVEKGDFLEVKRR